jgi:hypothetical protein
MKKKFLLVVGIVAMSSVAFLSSCNKDDDNGGDGTCQINGVNFTSQELKDMGYSSCAEAQDEYYEYIY